MAYQIKTLDSYQKQYGTTTPPNYFDSTTKDSGFQSINPNSSEQNIPLNTRIANDADTIGQSLTYSVSNPIKSGLVQSLASAGVGSLAGAAVGSVVPGIGTVAGAMIGGFLGSFGNWDNFKTSVKNLSDMNLASQHPGLYALNAVGWVAGAAGIGSARVISGATNAATETALNGIKEAGIDVSSNSLQKTTRQIIERAVKSNTFGFVKNSFTQTLKDTGLNQEKASLLASKMYDFTTPLQDSKFSALYKVANPIQSGFKFARNNITKPISSVVFGQHANPVTAVLGQQFVKDNPVVANQMYTWAKNVVQKDKGLDLQGGSLDAEIESTIYGWKLTNPELIGASPEKMAAHFQNFVNSSAMVKKLNDITGGAYVAGKGLTDEQASAIQRTIGIDPNEVQGKIFVAPGTAPASEAQIGITSAQPLNPLVSENLAKGAELYNVGKIDEAMPMLNQVTETTKPQLESTLKQDGATTIKNLETNTHGLYGGTPEPSYWLKVETNNKAETLASLAKNAKDNVQENFVYMEKANEGDKGATPQFQITFGNKIANKDIAIISKIFKDKNIGITLNQKTGELIAQNIKAFDNMSPVQFKNSMHQVIADLISNGYKLNKMELAFAKAEVYNASTYEKLISQSKSEFGRAVQPGGESYGNTSGGIRGQSGGSESNLYASRPTESQSATQQTIGNSTKFNKPILGSLTKEEIFSLSSWNAPTNNFRDELEATYPQLKNYRGQIAEALSKSPTPRTLADIVESLKLKNLVNFTDNPEAQSLASDIANKTGYTPVVPPQNREIFYPTEITPNLDLAKQRTTLGKVLDVLGLSSAPGITGEGMELMFQDNFARNFYEQIKGINSDGFVTIDNRIVPVENMYKYLEWARQQFGYMTISDFRAKDLERMGLTPDYVKVTLKSINDSMNLPASKVGAINKLVTYLRSSVPVFSKIYNGMLKIEWAGRYKYAPLYGYRYVMKENFLRTTEGLGSLNLGDNFITKLLHKTPWLGKYIADDVTVQDLELMHNFTLQMPDKNFDIMNSFEVGSWLKNMNLEKKLAVRNSNLFFKLINFSYETDQAITAKAFASKFGMSLSELLDGKETNGVINWAHPEQVAQLRNLTSTLYHYQPGILTSPLINTLNVIYFPARFDMKVLIQTTKWLEGMNPVPRTIMLEQMMHSAAYLQTPEGQNYLLKHKSMLNTAMDYIFPYVSIGKTIGEVFRLEPPQEAMIGGLPFALIGGILQGFGILPTSQAVSANGKTIPRLIPQTIPSGVATTLTDLLSFTFPLSTSQPSGTLIPFSLSRSEREALNTAAATIDEQITGRSNKQFKQVKPEYNIFTH